MIVPREPSDLKWCFSTLGCADLALDEICQLAGDFGIPSIELRGIGGRLDMVHYCAEQNLSKSRFLEICCRHRTQPLVAGSSLKLISAAESDKQELLQLSEWAESLGIRYLRVFGGGAWGATLSAEDYTRAMEVVGWWREQKQVRGWKLELLLETHDAFSGSAPCLELNRRLAEPLQLIWDSHHTWRLGREDFDETWGRLGSLVRHIHVKDSVDRPSARHPYTYVLPGEGQMPLYALLSFLQSKGFHGHVSLEWERLWHPYLPDLRTALDRLQSAGWLGQRELTTRIG